MPAAPASRNPMRSMPRSCAALARDGATSSPAAGAAAGGSAGFEPSRYAAELNPPPECPRTVWISRRGAGSSRPGQADEGTAWVPWSPPECAAPSVTVVSDPRRAEVRRMLRHPKTGRGRVALAGATRRGPPRVATSTARRQLEAGSDGSIDDVPRDRILGVAHTRSPLTTKPGCGGGIIFAARASRTGQLFAWRAGMGRRRLGVSNRGAASTTRRSARAALRSRGGPGEAVPNQRHDAARLRCRARCRKCGELVCRHDDHVESRRLRLGGRPGPAMSFMGLSALVFFEDRGLVPIPPVNGVRSRAPPRVARRRQATQVIGRCINRWCSGPAAPKTMPRGTEAPQPGPAAGGHPVCHRRWRPRPRHRSSPSSGPR